MRGSQKHPPPTFPRGAPLRRQCADELRLKQAAVAQLGFGASEADVAVLLDCYRAQPNVDATKIQRLCQQAAEAAPT